MLHFFPIDIKLNFCNRIEDFIQLTLIIKCSIKKKKKKKKNFNTSCMRVKKKNKI
jgi:hypothetical protein